MAGRKLACFGLVGTTVADDGMLERSYAEAIATQGVVPGTSAYARSMAQVHRSRGKPGIEVLRELFPGNEARAQAAGLAFDKALSGSVRRAGARPVPGAPQALDELAAAGYRSCLLSSFSRRHLDEMLVALGWADRFDLTVSIDDVRRGCPHPDPVLHAIMAAGLDDVRDAAVVQATESGILAGRGSGAGIVAAVQTGTHPAARLRDAGATHLLASVADVPALLAGLSSGAAAGAGLTAARRAIPRPAPEEPEAARRPCLG